MIFRYDGERGVGCLAAAHGVAQGEEQSAEENQTGEDADQSAGAERELALGFVLLIVLVKETHASVKGAKGQ